MSDRMSKNDRSHTMSRMLSKGNLSTELKLADLMKDHQIKGWRRQATELPGQPDFIFERRKVALFIDGCFWHGCPRCKLWPKSNVEYWTKKILGNRERDKLVKKDLERSGWTVMRFWEHQLDNYSWVVKKIKRII